MYQILFSTEYLALLFHTLQLFHMTWLSRWSPSRTGSPFSKDPLYLLNYPSATHSHFPSSNSLFSSSIGVTCTSGVSKSSRIPPQHFATLYSAIDCTMKSNLPWTVPSTVLRLDTHRTIPSVNLDWHIPCEIPCMISVASSLSWPSVKTVTRTHSSRIHYLLHMTLPLVYAE